MQFCDLKIKNFVIFLRVQFTSTLLLNVQPLFRCWNTHEEGYYWILKGPIMVSIFVSRKVGAII